MKNREKIEKIYSDNKERVRVNCNEAHAHSAMKHCLCGNKDAVDICFLYEYILQLEERLKSIRTITNEM